MEWGAIIKAALAVLSDERGRKAVVWIIVAVLSPVIVMAALFFGIAAGTSSHNGAVVNACFYGGSFTENVPAEYRGHIGSIRSAFSSLDSTVASANSISESGGLDPLQVKSIYYVLCFDSGLPFGVTAGRFAQCFYNTEVRYRQVEIPQYDARGTPIMETLPDGTKRQKVIRMEVPYDVTVPVPLSTAYGNVASLLGRTITDEEYKNIDHIYNMVCGNRGGGTYSGGYEAGGARDTEIDISGFKNPASKNAHDLAAYAVQAWENGWGYVWGTYGKVLTPSLFASKLEQYPDGVGNYEDFIRANWLGGRATDCVGLIKGYGWLEASSLEIKYGTNGMPDIGANQLYYNATESGTIETIPEIPGIAVWHKGHIGVYIGNGEVIEAMGTKYGVVKTQLEDRGWTHWLKVPYISYD